MPATAKERKRARRARRSKVGKKATEETMPWLVKGDMADAPRVDVQRQPVTMWQRQTTVLVDAFRIDFERQQGPGTGRYINADIITMVASLLEEAHAAEADWEDLDLDTLFARMSRDAPVDVFLQYLVVTTLGSFYCFLGNIGRVSPEKHDHMRHLSMLATIHGPIWHVLPQEQREAVWREVYGGACHGQA